MRITHSRLKKIVFNLLRNRKFNRKVSLWILFSHGRESLFLFASSAQMRIVSKTPGKFRWTRLGKTEKEERWWRTIEHLQVEAHLPIIPHPATEETTAKIINENVRHTCTSPCSRSDENCRSGKCEIFPIVCIWCDFIYVRSFIRL